MSDKERLNKKIQESWEHIKPYIKRQEVISELTEMCKNCEAWYGENHDYNNCLNEQCFRFWLAYQYLCWQTSWE